MLGHQLRLLMSLSLGFPGRCALSIALVPDHLKHYKPHCRVYWRQDHKIFLSLKDYPVPLGFDPHYRPHVLLAHLPFKNIQPWRSPEELQQRNLEWEENRCGLRILLPASLSVAPTNIW